MKAQKTISTISLAAAIGVLIQVQTAQASITLGGLETGGGTLTTTDGDFTFSDFSYTDPDSLGAGSLVVSTIRSGGIDYLSFSAAFIGANNSGGISDLEQDFSLFYTVTANKGAIYMIDQKYTPDVKASVIRPDDGITVAETVTGAGGVTYALSTLTYNPNVLSEPPVPFGSLDNLNVNPPQNVLYVEKDFDFDATAGNKVGLSIIDQSFHPVAVPEPTTVVAGMLLLLPLGASTVKILRHRKATA